MFYISLILIVTGSIFYEMIEKTVPKKENPYLYLTLVYLITAIGLGIILFFNDYRIDDFINQISWQALAVGVSAMFSDYGLMLCYRKGWKISTLNVNYTIFIFIFLTVIGFLFFHEDISIVECIGITLCVLSIILMNYKTEKHHRKRG